jgi:hypothetical protein
VDNDDFVLTWTEASELVRGVEDAFNAADLTAIATGFTEDATCRFADFPEMHGRPEIMQFLTARFARTQGYRLTKRLQVLTGNRLANTWMRLGPMQRPANRCWVEAPRSGSCAAAVSQCGTRHSTCGKKAGRQPRRLFNYDCGY